MSRSQKSSGRDIFVFILIVGGALWDLNETGAITYGVSRIIKADSRYDRLVL